MGFDPQNKEQPLVDPQKRTTKVNIAQVVAVIVFLVLTTAIMIAFISRPEETRNEVHEENVAPPPP